jgi:glycerol-3-phosphate acyltransferase PlsY
MLVVFAGCYILGAIPFGLIVGKVIRGVDIRDFGSGNIGASNVLRTLGKGPAFLVFVLDTGKGLAAMVVCRALGLDPWLCVIGAMLSILGHTYSVFLKFEGGKGVATSLGVIIGMDWHIAAIAFVGWVLLVGITRYISVASIIASLSVPLQMIFWKSMNVPLAYQVLASVAALAIVAKHKSNVQRLVSGTESRIGQRVDLETSESKEPA